MRFLPPAPFQQSSAYLTWFDTLPPPMNGVA
jgi:hypothetical protein